MMKKVCGMIRLARISAYLIIVLTLLSTVASPIYVQGALKVKVTGRVVDENGQGLKNVKVKAYSSEEGYEAYIKSTSTSSDGSFAIDLTVGKEYILRFSKKGYTKETRSIPIRMYGTGKINLGDIVLLKALRLSSPILSRVANPGDKLTFSFTVDNIGEKTMTVDLLVTKPEGWTARILDQISEVRKVNLPSGDSLSLNLEVTIPKDALGTYNLTLTATSNNKISSSLNFTITVEPPEHPHHDLELWTVTPVRIAKAGSSVDFNVEIKNSGTEGVVLNLILEGLPIGWKAHFFHGEGEIARLALKSGDSATIRVNIEIPESAEEGDYSFNFTANTGSFSEGIELKITVEPIEIEREMRLMCRYLSLTTEAGDAATYDIIVTNKGDRDEHIYFSTNVTSPDLDITFSAKEVEVAAGESLSLSVTVATRRGITPGEYTIPIVAETDDKQLSDSITLKLQVKGAYRLTLRLTPLNIRVTAGGESDVIASVHNEGQSTITNVKLEFDAPSGWTVISKPENILRLEPGRSADFTVTVKPPPDALAADYYVTVTAISDQAESTSRDLRVTVEVPTGWGYFGVIAIAIIILAVAGIFWKVRRK